MKLICIATALRAVCRRANITRRRPLPRILFGGRGYASCTIKTLIFCTKFNNQGATVGVRQAQCEPPYIYLCGRGAIRLQQIRGETNKKYENETRLIFFRRVNTFPHLMNQGQTRFRIIPRYVCAQLFRSHRSKHKKGSPPGACDYAQPAPAKKRDDILPL